MLDWKDKTRITSEAEEKRAHGHARMAKEPADKTALERFRRPAFSAVGKRATIPVYDEAANKTV